MPSWLPIIVASVNTVRGFIGLRRLMCAKRHKNSTPRRYLRLRGWQIGSFEHYSITIREEGIPPSREYRSVRRRGIARVPAELTSVVPELAPPRVQSSDPSPRADDRAPTTSKTMGQA